MKNAQASLKTAHAKKKTLNPVVQIAVGPWKSKVDMIIDAVSILNQSMKEVMSKQLIRAHSSQASNKIQTNHAPEQTT